MNLIRPYVKIYDMECGFACIAVYEPHPFRDSAIQDAVKSIGKKSNQHTGIDDDEWCWIFYDWCGNPVAISDEMPEGKFTYQVKPEHFEWMGHDNAVRFCEYINKEPNTKAKIAWEMKYGER